MSQRDKDALAKINAMSEEERKRQSHLAYVDAFNEGKLITLIAFKEMFEEMIDELTKKS